MFVRCPSAPGRGPPGRRCEVSKATYVPRITGRTSGAVSQCLESILIPRAAEASCSQETSYLQCRFGPGPVLMHSNRLVGCKHIIWSGPLDPQRGLVLICQVSVTYGLLRHFSDIPSTGFTHFTRYPDCTSGFWFVSFMPIVFCDIHSFLGGNSDRV